MKKRNFDDGRRFPPVVHGLDGIMQVFGISKGTAWRYRHGIIKEACTQKGKIIFVDVRMALELFGVKDPGNLIRSDAE